MQDYVEIVDSQLAADLLEFKRTDVYGFFAIK
jgi:hypothetical protein